MNQKIRKVFGSSLLNEIEVPDLVCQQIQSYNNFLQRDTLPENRINDGLQALFASHFPIANANNTVRISFVHYHIDAPEYSPEACKMKDISYSAPIKIVLELSVFEDGQENIKRQHAYIGEMPLITDSGTFVINGIERVVISQFHRAPGLFFESNDSDSNSTEYIARVIPDKGAWIDFEIDDKQQISILINKKRLRASTFLMSILEESAYDHRCALMQHFYSKIKLVKKSNNLWLIQDSKQIITDSYEAPFDVYNANGELLLDAESGIDEAALSQHKELYIKDVDLMSLDMFAPVILHGRLVCELGKRLTQQHLSDLPDGFVVDAVHPNMQWGSIMMNCIIAGKVSSKKEALFKICTLLKINDNLRRGAHNIIEDSLFNNEKYNLSEVGRMKLNDQLDLNITDAAITITDLISIQKKIISISLGKAKYGNPDSLEYRRVRLVGELVSNQLQQSISKLARSIQDRLGTISKDTTVSELVNSRYFISTIREFFGSSQLSQFMDQTNPLSELSHKRRISAFGVGGVSRERAWLDLRDMHPSHYGRICMIETPEGQAIGLVNSMAIFARTDKYGFITTPYYKVINKQITDQVMYLSASEEVKYAIAYLDSKILNTDLTFKEEMIHCRKGNEERLIHASEIEFIDVSPKQILSASSSLIPFIECDDAVRALMGANMQRQALPLLKPTAPLIGTGMEEKIVKDSSASVIAKNSGFVSYVSADCIIVQNDQNANNCIDTYQLTKLQKSNDGTLLDQVTCVNVGDYVKAGDFLTNGPAIDKGEIALGRNAKIAFLSFRGLNYEDAIVISSTFAKEFTSIGLTKLEISAREMRQGVERFTSDLPNVDNEFTANLDESGIVNLGTYVKAGDILVGRLTPKAEASVSPDERLLRAIFGSKSIDVKDTSLRVPPGVHGVVVDVRIFNRKSADRTQRAIEIQNKKAAELENKRRRELKHLDAAFLRVASKIAEDNLRGADKESLLGSIYRGNIDEILRVAPNTPEFIKLTFKYRQQKATIDADFQKVYKELSEGSNLAIDVLETVQIFIATKYIIQSGDKVAGRHGNKGTISRVMAPENMPFTKDGQIVDIIFTSTGISGRMNIGQVLETHLGWASVNLGKKINEMAEQAEADQQYIDSLRALLLEVYDHPDENKRISDYTSEELCDFARKLKNGVPFACPAFDSPDNAKVNQMLTLAGCDPSGKEYLYDGETGLCFPQKVTVGIMYVMQLRHLVEKKEHARSVGSYSIITQQPLGGKSQMGGQRFGEMEVWSLQAYSAAYLLREMLTVKSDYPLGRARVFELISQGYDVFDQKGVPESFCVLLYELRALCLNVDCLVMQDSEFSIQSLVGLENFDALKISIADSAQVRSWSYGEVTKPETIHYRTFKPHPEGIFSTKIFGPIRDYRCLCGRHNGQKRRGIVCSKCETPVISSKVRRHRMGHIELVAPVIHVWMAKVLPSRAAVTLDISITNLNKILRFESYVVASSGLSPYKAGAILDHEDYINARDEYENSGFEAMTGPEAIEYMLDQIDLQKECTKIRSILSSSTESVRMHLVRRLKILEAFLRNNVKPSSMIIRTLPILPPELRPLVPLDGGRFASSDVNELYRRVINRNNRLGKLLKYATPEVIIRNEKRMLQEAVDALFDNSRRTRPVLNSSNKRPLKSLTDSIKGKQGRFRQNLLGKRVDYSGRSVIVVGPQLKLHQCGLPKTMALELFKPFVLSRLVLRGFASTIRIAKMMIESPTEEVWNILTEVTRNHVVLLNRAPTLHRLSIQAFEVVLVEGRAIQTHPLTCPAFNSDYDGDQKGVHVPLSIEAQIEARTLMMSTKCILNPSNGLPIATAAKDMVLGLYALTCIERGFSKHEEMVIANIHEAEMLIVQEIIRHSTPIRAFVDNVLYDTTYGRLKLYSVMPKHEDLSFDLVNKAIQGTDMKSLIHKIYISSGEDKTVAFLDSMMQLGFEYATLSGTTFSYSDLPVPAEKAALVQEAEEKAEEYQRQYNEGLIRAEERYNKVTAAWGKCADQISEHLLRNIAQETPGKMLNPIYMMAKSGARGSDVQIRQLAGMRGLMAKSDGSIHEHPIINSFIERMNTREQMLASQGARKGLIDIALRTADSGYFFRRTIDATQDCVTEINDCNTTDYIEKRALIRDGNQILSLSKRIFGRVLAEDIYDDDTIIAKSGDIVDSKLLKKIEILDLLSVKVRSPITCKYDGPGICSKCYGYDMSNLSPVSLNVSVGVIAAQSIGEPCTQLTMKNFQSGGAARLSKEGRIVSVHEGLVSMPSIRIAHINGDGFVVSRNNLLNIIDHRGRIIDSYRIAHGSKMHIKDGDMLEKGQLIAEWDPYSRIILAENNGVATIHNIKNMILKEVYDYDRGVSKLVVKQMYGPAFIHIKTPQKTFEYALMVNDILEIADNQQVQAGASLIRRMQNVAKTQDIIGGFASIVDLFECRPPKTPAVISEISGTIEIVRSTPQKIIVRSHDKLLKKEYSVPNNINAVVDDGDTVEAGDYLTDGRPCMHDILRARGTKGIADYFINEAQSIYQSQGIEVNDKHFEVILRQMVHSAQIVDPGDTLLLHNDVIRMQEVTQLNQILRNMNKREIVFIRVMHGITQAAMIEKTSFFAAASFQFTVQTLLEAAIQNSIDPLRGMKESLIVGRLIPSGAGNIIRKAKMHCVDDSMPITHKLSQLIMI